jgi:ABC-type phosphate transport system substrate-binding protein
MFMRSLRAVVVLVLAAAPARPVAAYKVVVHAENAVSSMSKPDVAKLFLKKVTSWPGGEAVAPVDLPGESSVRKAFCHGVLGKDLLAVESYWQQAIFSGRAVPPPEKPSDAQVLAYVREHPNAIGYVSGEADLGASVKELTID